MKLILCLLATILLFPLASAEMAVDIDISRNDIVTESFNVNFQADDTYTSFEFASETQPVSVSYDGDFEFLESEGIYIITFFDDIKEGMNNIHFSLIYDSLIQSSGEGKVIRTSLLSESGESIKVNMMLPEGYFLSGKPSASPPPKDISSNGRKILLEFEVESGEPIVVFYESNSPNFAPIIIIFVVILGITAASFTFMKRKTAKKLEDVLSEDEKRIINEVKSGNTKQKEIAAKLDFSKSKMSKVVRKLEEKNLIERTPHFKTNILKIKK